MPSAYSISAKINGRMASRRVGSRAFMLISAEAIKRGKLKQEFYKGILEKASKEGKKSHLTLSYVKQCLREIQSKI